MCEAQTSQYIVESYPPCFVAQKDRDSWTVCESIKKLKQAWLWEVIIIWNNKRIDEMSPSISAGSILSFPLRVSYDSSNNILCWHMWWKGLGRNTQEVVLGANCRLKHFKDKFSDLINTGMNLYVVSISHIRSNRHDGHKAMVSWEVQGKWDDQTRRCGRQHCPEMDRSG